MPGWSGIQQAINAGQSYKEATPEYGETPWNHYHMAVSSELKERVPGLFKKENQEEIWKDLLFIKRKSDEERDADPNFPKPYEYLYDSEE